MQIVVLAVDSVCLVVMVNSVHCSGISLSAVI